MEGIGRRERGSGVGCGTYRAEVFEGCEFEDVFHGWFWEIERPWPDDSRSAAIFTVSHGLWKGKVEEM
jgi:hypothetical protein